MASHLAPGPPAWLARLRRGPRAGPHRSDARRTRPAPADDIAPPRPPRAAARCTPAHTPRRAASPPHRGAPSARRCRRCGSRRRAATDLPAPGHRPGRARPRPTRHGGTRRARPPPRPPPPDGQSPGDGPRRACTPPQGPTPRGLPPAWHPHGLPPWGHTPPVHPPRLAGVRRLGSPAPHQARRERGADAAAHRAAPATV